jgi:predicted oxidoreductase (fatty acid repression mutant protein)
MRTGLPFGVILAHAGEKEFSPIGERFRVV